MHIKREERERERERERETVIGRASGRLLPPAATYIPSGGPEYRPEIAKGSRLAMRRAIAMLALESAPDPP